MGLVPVFALATPPWGFGLWVTGGAVVLSMVLCCSLTVRVEDGTLTWDFGPRFWKNTLPLASLDRVETVRNTATRGWGIRRIEGGWLYNVSGFDAVELETNGGDVIRIGTDEPDRLASVLEEATE